MKNNILFEDTTMLDADRWGAGIGPGAKDSGNIDVNIPAEADPQITAPKILPFHIQNSIPIIANYITELMTMKANLENYANSDISTSKQMVVTKLVEKINKINSIFAADIMRLLDKLAL